MLGISARAIQKWEAGRTRPSAANLQSLIALYAQRGTFSTAQAMDEARALWEAAFATVPYRTTPFDAPWFAGLHAHLLRAGGTAVSVATSMDRQDWGEAPEAILLSGRTREAATLSRWLLADHARLLLVLGLGGIGKTALAARVAQDLASHFDALYWRSAGGAPSVEEWLAAAIGVLAPDQAVLSREGSDLLAVLLRVLRAQRCLLVLDNIEAVLQPGEPELRYLPGYEGYGLVLRRLVESAHQGCLLVIGTEEPPDLARLAGERSSMYILRLGGLDVEAGQALLQDTIVAGEPAAWQTLIDRSGGNPLVLKMVAHTIAELFAGQIDAFLAYTRGPAGAVFAGTRQLLGACLDKRSEQVVCSRF